MPTGYGTGPTGEIERWYEPQGDLTIPSSFSGIPVKDIGHWAFWETPKITSLTIPYGVRGIGRGAFYSCSNLQSVTIPDSVVSIEGEAFAYCTRLTTLTIPESVTSLEKNPGTFRDSNLRTLYVPASWQGTSMLNGTQVPTNCQVIYYTPGAQTVTFNANGGNCETSTKTYSLDGKYSNLPTATWTGYTFDGWYTATDGGSKITEGKAVSTNWFLTLYAHWMANTYSVKLDRQGGTGGTTSVSATTGTAMPDIAVPTRTGYSFGGYYTAANGQGRKYYTAEGKSARAWGEGTASTLYAKWTANSYTVTFDRQGGEGGAGSVTATYGSPMPTIVAPTRTDYVFGGYYSAKNGEGTQYYAATGESMRAWDKVSATTLYAKWTSTTLSIAPPTRNFGTGGGAYAIVTSGSGTWSAETGETWITLNASSGQAGYPVAYAVGATTQAESRTGHVFVSGHVHTVTQDGQGAMISPASATFEREGGEGTISVTVREGVEWKAISNCEWVGVTPTSGTGPGSVAFTVSLLGESGIRQGTLTVAGQTFRIGQNGSATLDYLTHTNSISVEAPAIAEWRVTSDANWISVVDAGNGKGNGTVTIAIEENSSWKPRTGTVQIGTMTFTVTQKGRTALEFDISPTRTTASVEGENGLIAVTATPDLPWSAESTAHWLTISGTTGTGAGNGNVEYSAAPNPTLYDRIGTILVTPGDTKVDAQMHTVTQPAASSALSATEHEFAAEGGSCKLKVKVSDIVEWQIQNPVPWLTVAGATNRVGPATLTLKAAATDMLQPRSGTVTIAGKSFTVTQAAASSLLTPTGYEFGEDGGSCEVWVSVPDIVNWQIRNTNSWLKVVGATNRVGPVPVTLQAVANETVDSKEGTVTIAGKAFAVSQKGRGVEVGYETKLFGADGGSDTLSIHPEGNASWTAVVSDPTWITVFGSNSGMGAGEVMYIVSSFVGDETERTGTITVGDKVVFITQRAFDLSISPKKTSVAGESGTGSFKVSTGSDNAWQALVPDSWLSLVEENDSGTGNGTVKYRYAANDTGTARKGKILVVGEVFTLQQQSRPPFPEAQDAAEIATFLDKAVDRRLGWRIRSMEEYDSFRAWLTEKGIDRQAVKDSPHAWISYALGAERLFGEEPTIQIDGLSVVRNGTRGVENGLAMDVCVVVHDDAGEVPVDAGKVVGLFEATDDLCDWDGDAKLSATATQTGSDGATMQFKVVPGDGDTDEAFLRLGIKERDARKSQTISIASIGEPTWLDRVNLSALASSGGPVTFEVVSGPGKLEGNVLSFTAPGTVKVQALQTGNDMWLPATAAQTVTVMDMGINEAPYIVVDLSAGSGEGAVYPVTCLGSVPDGGWSEEYKTTKLVLRRIEPGTFKMCGRYQTTLTKPYYMGVFEVTQKQYELVTGGNPSKHKGDQRPVEYVTWNTIRGKSGTYNWPTSSEVDANSFMGRLRARTELEFDLPTEAQWEYACRAGTTTDLNNGKNLTTAASWDPALDEVGRFWQNKSDGKGGYSEHTTVGSYMPNSWGLYDMHGNVYEWCLDWYGSLADGATDPEGPSSGSERVIRGGCWRNDPQEHTSSHRRGYEPSDGYDCSGTGGFRLVRILSE
ncbi:MAG: SUMF1/EgtB/PvdO family nonheme iron enzyme [Kiritimatiellae bacterium]|nr:SUMF1/EgtB/PvdO family nonheme iron enzyme [Kiritimatiellia bacterium]